LVNVWSQQLQTSKTSNKHSLKKRTSLARLLSDRMNIDTSCDQQGILNDGSQKNTA